VFPRAMPTSRVRISGFVLSLGLAAFGCNLFDTGNAENVSGNGPKSFDPYAGPSSGAIRLGLQMYNGCAILATGEPVGRGSAHIPYPDNCPRYEYQDPVAPVASPPPMQLRAGTTYFLNQVTIEEGVTGLHTDASDMGAVADWIRNQTSFA